MKNEIEKETGIMSPPIVTQKVMALTKFPKSDIIKTKYKIPASDCKRY